MLIPAWALAVAAFAVFLVLAIVCAAVADKGGSNMFDFGDLFTGCLLPVVLVLLGIIAALVVLLVVRN